MKRKMAPSRDTENPGSPAFVTSSAPMTSTPIVPYRIESAPVVANNFMSSTGQQGHENGVMMGATELTSSNNSLITKRGMGGLGMALEVLMPHQRPIPEFLYQLTQMLSDGVNSSMIEWNGSSRSVVVHDPTRLEAEVLQKYFRHSRFASFQRQLNYFGFRKKAGKGRMSPCSYTNVAATEDLRSLLLIKRKRTRRCGQSRTASEPETSSDATETETTEPETETTSSDASDAGSETGTTRSLEEPLAVPSMTTIEEQPLELKGADVTKDTALPPLSLSTHSHEYGPPGTIDFEPDKTFSFDPLLVTSIADNNLQISNYLPATAAAAALPILPQSSTSVTTPEAPEDNTDLLSAFPDFPQYQQQPDLDTSTDTDNDIRRLVSFLNRSLPSTGEIVSRFGANPPA